MIPGLRFQMVSELKEKSKAVIKLHPNSRIAYAVFSKSGFSGNADATDKDTLLMDLGDIEKSLERMKKEEHEQSGFAPGFNHLSMVRSGPDGI